jgi:DNA invertase Pin-like site-specific DNA recombinase
MLGAWAMAADMERRRIQERTQGARSLLREQGMFVEGTVPFGYKLPKDGTRRLVIGNRPTKATVTGALTAATSLARNPGGSDGDARRVEEAGGEV